MEWSFYGISGHMTNCSPYKLELNITNCKEHKVISMHFVNFVILDLTPYTVAFAKRRSCQVLSLYGIL